MNEFDSSIYRETSYCNNCPFKDKGKAVNLSEERYQEIQDDLLYGSNQTGFICHKTIGENQKVCYGAYKFMLKHNVPCLQMSIARYKGEVQDE